MSHRTQQGVAQLRVRPTASERPYSSWMMPVDWSTGIRARPGRRHPTTAPIGGATGMNATRATSAHGVQPTAATITTDEGRGEQHDVEPAGSAVTESNRERALAGRPHRSECHGGCSPPAARTRGADAGRHQQPEPRQPFGLDVLGADGGNQAEEDEDADLAESAVPVR